MTADQTINASAAADAARRQRISRGLYARSVGTAASGHAANLPGFPPGIAYDYSTYTNWSGAISAGPFPTAAVQTASDVVAVANWAKDNGYVLRAVGSSHNWSPLVVPQGTTSATPVLLVDTRGLVTTPAVETINGTTAVTFSTGMTLDAVTAFLEQRDNNGSGTAPGYTFQNMPGPGGLTLGGALAIGAHGTGVSWTVPEPSLNGCLSNLILGFTAVVTDPAQPEAGYVLKHFDRGDPDASAFLVHLGRAFLTDVTLQVMPNYYLQVTNSFPSVSTLFEPASTVQSGDAISTLLDNNGRLEVIWFPYTQSAWVKTWRLQTSEIQPQVAGPYNYPFANNISALESNIITDGLLAFPEETPRFGEGELLITSFEAPSGAVMNGTSRDLLLYVKDNTLRVGAFGYAVHLPRSEVQSAAATFYAGYTQLLQQYQAQGKYPVNTAVEIRYTTVDLTSELATPGAAPPALSATRPIDPSLDTVFWVDALTVPGTASASDFFADLEAWMYSIWGSSNNNALCPEWSKGWAYTAAGGAWTNQDVIQHGIPAHYGQTFETARATLAQYDASHIFSNSFLDTLLPG